MGNSGNSNGLSLFIRAFCPQRVRGGATSSASEKQTGYIDGCFDIMHSGHFNAIRQARSLCDRLVVGVHSDDEIARNKGPPVMLQDERYGLLNHIKWIDEIVTDVPYSPSIATLDGCGADFAVHGDDMPVNSEGVGAYDSLRDAGRLKIVKRTEGVSTTDFIGRLLTSLKKAKELGSFLIVGIHDDDTVNRIKGANYPIATLQERVLCVCSCKWVDEVIIGAPLTVTEDMIQTLNINHVVVGSHTKTHHFREAGYRTDVLALSDTAEDPYAVPKKKGLMKVVQSDYPELNTAKVAKRVAENRLAYISRNNDREKRESDYYAGKKASAKTQEY
eukprot:g8075.t1